MAAEIIRGAGERMAVAGQGEEEEEEAVMLQAVQLCWDKSKKKRIWAMATGTM